jgi:hypothetical protein
MDIVTIPNGHTVDCGQPPKIVWDDLKYFSYFEGGCGDQVIYTVEKRDSIPRVYGGDWGWEPCIVHGIGIPDAAIRLPRVRRIFPYVHGLILGPEESIWLRACWAASAHLIDKEAIRIFTYKEVRDHERQMLNCLDCVKGGREGQGEWCSLGHSPMPGDPLCPHFVRAPGRPERQERREKPLKYAPGVVLAPPGTPAEWPVARPGRLLLDGAGDYTWASVVDEMIFTGRCGTGSLTQVCKRDGLVVVGQLDAAALREATLAICRR